MIRTYNLSKRYGSLVALDDLNLTVKKGEFFSLLGVNGAGKTTAIKLLTGLSKPTAGDIYIGGLNLKENAHQVKCMIGVSAQESAIAPNLTVYENLAFMCNVYGFSSAKTKAKIEEVTAQMDLAAVLYRKAGQLSGGWKRRVSIAMAIISEPEILFLDEPTLGLDILARRALWDLLHSLRTQERRSLHH